jgi:hypothetical protein
MIPSETSSSVQPAQMMQFLQSIKGAPASVLLALALSGRSLTVKDLQTWTRCGHSQVTNALRSLLAAGWVRARTFRGPWMLASGRQLPFDFFLTGTSALKALSSSSDTLNYTTEGTLLPSARREHIIKALYACGIREPTASELVELPHMTPEYLQAHVEAARANGLRIGSAIENMRLGAPPLHTPTPKSRQAEVDEKIRRFQEGS